MLYASQQYLLLRRAYPEAPDNEPIGVTLRDVAGKLYCSERNAKLVIRKMCECGWISWTPGRGRGNRSALTFRVDRARMLIDNAKHVAQRGDVPGALELIRRYGDDTSAKERFGDWLSEYFGYKAEGSEREAVEVLRFPVHWAIYSLDPIVTFSALDMHIINQVFDTLVRYDRVAETFVPGLAHHWEADEANMTWTFYLRKGVQFHHGREMTADDAAFTFGRLRGPSPLFRDIERIVAVNRTTLRIRLRAPNYLFLRFVSNATASIVPRDVCEEKGDRFGREPVGTGAFMVTINQPSRLVLEAFLPYFQGRAHLDRVEMIVVPPDCETIREPRLDRIVFGHESPAKHPSWAQQETIVSGCSLMTFNMNRDGPQRSFAFRHALHHLTDRRRMIAELGGDRTMPAKSFIADPDEAGDDFVSDPELGAELLRQAGYNGEPFRLLTGEKHVKDALWLQRRYREFGVNVVVETLPWLNLLSLQDWPEADGMLFQNVLDEDEVTQIESWRSDKSIIRIHLAEHMKAKCDRAIAAVLGEPSKAKRRAMLRELERLHGEERSLLFLLHKKMSTSVHPSVKGAQFNTLGWIDFKHLWFQHDTETVAGPDATTDEDERTKAGG
ncbi:ABC transporter substrate-binding protein [Paenibacillus sp. GYB003]|uniref:ABC transporter substrate-binding protein n=1 Tax=Paenibacillus sp. GYB003 TaxID=2994392 RepID=UPI002F96943C